MLARVRMRAIDGSVMVNIIGERVRARRMARGMTQLQLGEAAGLEESAISHVETGRREPRARALTRLARALACSSDYLLGLREKP